jgi:glycosyltransferase involved in cell wall biosynthesis
LPLHIPNDINAFSMKSTLTTSIIVTCKNRLHHLQQTLPTYASQSDVEVIVVDYGCTQGTEQWVRANFPAITVVAVRDDPVFNLSRARNAGASIAQGRFLLFVDADIKINSDLGSWALKNACDNSYYLEPESNTANIFGTMLCAKADFDRVGGYDEAFRGWGGEDRDIYYRFLLAGIANREFDKGSLEAIPHDNSERQLSFADGGMGTIEHGLLANHLYMNIKYDLVRLTGKALDLPQRMEIMQAVKRALVKVINSPEPGKNEIVEINLANTIFGGLDLSRHFSKKLLYQVTAIIK